LDLYVNYPTITYDNKLSKNIITKMALARNIIEKYRVFYPYNVKDGERADTIAYDYYGSSDFEWLVLLSNNMIDVHSEWPKSYNQFYRYMLEKYGDINATKSQIMYYTYTGIGGDTDYDIGRKSWKMSINTYNTLSAEEKSGWTPVYLYDHELEENEKKRSIILLSNVYVNQVEAELRSLFNV